ncbi:hypothetical protein H0H81_003075 [Sphagnurus paluster]|uniref:Uncharacterized protein n=1 Tax=Sphagnurus paluster TaxID=117069 RepID=A0A9P7GU03_9AGAR|nr:hypothetical protein H0H81_003075 [Sphagnurus paluster]
MANEEISEGPPSGLFFAGSDDEEDVPMEQANSPSATTSRASSPPTLFLPDSEDEATPDLMILSPPTVKRKLSLPDDEDDEIRLPSPITYRRASSVHSVKAEPKSESPALQPEPKGTAGPPPKKRRISPAPTAPTLPAFPPTYLGEVLVPNAWSNVSGKGYIKNNEPIRIHRDEQEDSKPGPSKPTAQGKKKGDGKKQMSLTAMLKPQPSKVKKKVKGDHIVRILNTRGIDPRVRPSSNGCNLVGIKTFGSRTLRERKEAVLQLFKVIGLKPQAGGNFRDPQDEEKVQEEALKHLANHKAKKVTEIVGDNEEIEVDDAEDLSKNDLDAIYKRAQLDDRAMGTMEPADTFTLTLRGYQKQALLWMHSLESGEMSARESSSMHPLWTQYFFPPKPDGGYIDLTADEIPFYMNPYSGEMSLDFPKSERNFRGGILADVGMGKTIMLSALIHTSPPSEDVTTPQAVKSRQLKLNNAFRPVTQRKAHKPSSATLIVAPTSLLAQWAEELERSSKPGTIKTVVWHGQNRLDLEAATEDTDDDDTCIKIIITSYGVLASEHAKSEKSTTSKSPVFEIDWLRIILDEAHACKSRSSKTAKAVYALQARRRWAVTGTPIVNKLEDLYSLLKFLNFKPWSDFAFFRSFITLPFLARDPKAIEVVQVILETVLLRREKNMRDTDGNKIVELPTKEVLVDVLEFSPLERKIYDQIYTSAKKNFESLDARGLVSRNYTQILAMLMRLRRAVLHPSLVLKSDDERVLSPHSDGAVDVNDLIRKFTENENTSEGGNVNVFAEEVLSTLAEAEAGECPICLDVMEIPMIIPKCMHQWTASSLILLHVKKKVKILDAPPVCKVLLNELLEVIRRNKDEGVSSSQVPGSEVTLRRNDFHSSTKLQALIKSLQKIRDQDPCFRAVVFSQFTSFLDLIQVALERERYDQYRFDGSMDIKKKNAAVAEFRAPSRKPKVLVVSLKAGGVGLNLTTANHVFMMDCWWNSAIENQAIDRVHRIGQEKTVYVTHFIVANTIEGRILQIQKRKTAIVKEAFKGTQSDAKSDPESIENLKIMFGDD